MRKQVCGPPVRDQTAPARCAALAKMPTHGSTRKKAAKAAPPVVLPVVPTTAVPLFRETAAILFGGVRFGTGFGATFTTFFVGFFATGFFATGFLATFSATFLATFLATFFTAPLRATCQHHQRCPHAQHDSVARIWLRFIQDTHRLLDRGRFEGRPCQCTHDHHWRGTCDGRSDTRDGRCASETECVRRSAQHGEDEEEGPSHSHLDGELCVVPRCPTARRTHEGPGPRSPC